MNTNDRPAPFLTAMMEGSFASLIWLSAIAFAAPDPHYRNLAMLALGAVSISIAIMLALPSSWLRRTPRHPDKRSAIPLDSRPAAAEALLIVGTNSTPAQPAHKGELV